MIGARTVELACFPGSRVEEPRGTGGAPAGLSGAALAIHRAEQRARLVPGSVIADRDETDTPAPASADGNSSHSWEAWLRAS